jgi:hypothetical protein
VTRSPSNSSQPEAQKRLYDTAAHRTRHRPWRQPTPEPPTTPGLILDFYATDTAVDACPPLVAKARTWRLSAPTSIAMTVTNCDYPEPRSDLPLTKLDTRRRGRLSTMRPSLLAPAISSSVSDRGASPDGRGVATNRAGCGCCGGRGRPLQLGDLLVLVLLLFHNQAHAGSRVQSHVVGGGERGWIGSRSRVTHSSL